MLRQINVSAKMDFMIMGLNRHARHATQLAKLVSIVVSVRLVI